MNESTPAYGLWSLVLLNSAIFIMFAFSFFKPQTARDWRSFGAFAAFIRRRQIVRRCFRPARLVRREYF